MPKNDVNKVLDYSRVQELHDAAEEALREVSAANADPAKTPEERRQVKDAAARKVQEYQVAYNLWRSPMRVSQP